MSIGNEFSRRRLEHDMKWKAILFLVVPSVILAGLLAGVGMFLYFYYTLPSIKSLGDYAPPIITTIYSEDDEVIGEFYKERRIVVPIEAIPPVLTQAFVAAEDAAFFEHEGISYVGILRAMAKNLRAGRFVQGGSTITQQVVRSLLLSRERTLSRKIREIMLAHRLEKYLTKDEILYLYLNQIYLGHGNYGVEAAARDYFNKGVEELSLAEASLLAGLTRAPEKYSPLKSLPLAKTRQAYALKRMVEVGYISEQEADDAFQAPLTIQSRENKFLNVAPYFTEHVRIYLKEKYGEDAVYTQGLQVDTTLNLNMQQAAQVSLEDGVRALDRRQGYRGPERALAKEEIDAFCQQTARELADEPLAVGVTYQGVVTGFSKDEDAVLLRVGDYKGFIPFSSMRWARPPDPDTEYTQARLLKPSQALKPGYVIRVTLEEKPAKGPGKFGLYQEPAAQGALFSMEIPTGYVRAMVGGTNFLKTQFNRAVQARRQPGSAFKPLVYAAALDQGYTPGSVIIDSPVIYYDALKGEDWKPKNFEERFYGPTTFREALTHSRNVITIKLVRDIGVSHVVKYAQRLGIESPLTPDLSLALGSSEVTLEELVRAYAVFASRGHLLSPIFVTRVRDRNGTVLEENRPLPLEADLRQYKGMILEQDLKRNEGGFYPQVISEQTSYIMTSLLQGVVQRGTGWRARALGRTCAGKTGTTNEYTDAWFLGYTPDLIAGVWVGFDEKKPLGKMETGSRAASPIWLSFMTKALEHTPSRDFPIPEGIVFAKIDPETGLLAPPDNPDAIFECFKEGTQPTEYSTEITTLEMEDLLKSDAVLQLER